MSKKREGLRVQVAFRNGYWKVTRFEYRNGKRVSASPVGEARGYFSLEDAFLVARGRILEGLLEEISEDNYDVISRARLAHNKIAEEKRRDRENSHNRRLYEIPLYPRLRGGNGECPNCGAAILP